MPAHAADQPDALHARAAYHSRRRAPPPRRGVPVEAQVEQSGRPAADLAARLQLEDLHDAFAVQVGPNAATPGSAIAALLLEIVVGERQAVRLLTVACRHVSTGERAVVRAGRPRRARSGAQPNRSRRHRCAEEAQVQFDEAGDRAIVRCRTAAPSGDGPRASRRPHRGGGKRPRPRPRSCGSTACHVVQQCREPQHQIGLVSADRSRSIAWVSTVGCVQTSLWCACSSTSRRRAGTRAAPAARSRCPRADGCPAPGHPCAAASTAHR